MRTALKLAGSRFAMVVIAYAILIPISFILVPPIDRALKQLLPTPMCHCPLHPPHPLEKP